MIFEKRLKMLPEQDIMNTLKDFDVFKEKRKHIMVALALVDRDNIIIKDNNSYEFKDRPKKLLLFNHSNSVQSILRRYCNKRVLVEVYIKDIFSSIVLDMKSYKSVKETYECLEEMGYKINSDEELIKYATTEMCPRIRFVRCEKNLGKEAFKGSNVREHTLECLVCYDTDLILNMRAVK